MTGLTGDAKLIELGGPPYLLPLVQRDKLYDLAKLAGYLHRDPAFMAGAGAGPWPYIGVNCEVSKSPKHITDVYMIITTK